jgi:hypothetical protein
VNKYIKYGLIVVVGALAVLVIERKTGIFSKVFGKIPGVNTLI